MTTTTTATAETTVERIWTLDLGRAGLRRAGPSDAQPPREVVSHRTGRLPIRYQLVAWDSELQVAWYEADVAMETACADNLAPALLSWASAPRGA